MTGYVKIVLHPCPVIPMLIYKLFAIHIIANFNNTFKRQNILKESVCCGTEINAMFGFFFVDNKVYMIYTLHKTFNR